MSWWDHFAVLGQEGSLSSSTLSLWGLLPWYRSLLVLGQKWKILKLDLPTAWCFFENKFDSQYIPSLPRIKEPDWMNDISLLLEDDSWFWLILYGYVLQFSCDCSEAYYLNSHLTKRTWALIFGGLSLSVDLLPTLHNFRVFSFIGVLTTTYTAWYMLTATLTHGQV